MPTRCRETTRRLEKTKKADRWQKEADEVDEALYEDRAPRAQHAAKSAASLRVAEQEVLRQRKAGEALAQPPQSLGAGNGSFLPSCVRALHAKQGAPSSTAPL